MALKRDREAIGQHCGAERMKKDSTIIDQRSRINDGFERFNENPGVYSGF
jgi:hypothetical protein